MVGLKEQFEKKCRRSIKFIQKRVPKLCLNAKRVQNTLCCVTRQLFLNILHTHSNGSPVHAAGVCDILR